MHVEHQCKHSIQTFNANIQFEYSLHIMSTFINIGIPISPFSDFIPSLKLFVVEKGNGMRLLLCFPAERLMRDACISSKVLCHAFESFIVNVQVNNSQSTPRRFSLRTFRGCYHLLDYVCNPHW